MSRAKHFQTAGLPQYVCRYFGVKRTSELTLQRAYGTDLYKLRSDHKSLSCRADNAADARRVLCNMVAYETESRDRRVRIGRKREETVPTAEMFEQWLEQEYPCHGPYDHGTSGAYDRWKSEQKLAFTAGYKLAKGGK